MSSPREAFKDILINNADTDAGQTVTSKIQNVTGRQKNTFLFIAEQDADFTIQWAWGKQGPWYNLPDATNLAISAGILKRVTFDDAFTYLRAKIVYGGTPGKLSAWYSAL